MIAKNRPCRSDPSFYFGQPSGGFFFCRDFLTAVCHGPFNLRMSGLGPGADFGFFIFCFLGMSVFSEQKIFKS